ncbi:hypothetical protein BH23BAC2_BH23BAC2_18120 [soil metagenome]
MKVSFHGLFHSIQHQNLLSRVNNHQGMADLGRDLICKKDGKTHIVQCKYWSDKRGFIIRENHVMQYMAQLLNTIWKKAKFKLKLIS